MRAYLAVLKDSFREALASRVLWILLILITIFLLALAPLAIKEELAAELQISEIRNGQELINDLVDGGKSSEPSPAKHIWGLLSSNMQEQLTGLQSKKPEERDDSVTTLFLLTRELNELFNQTDFYDEAAWRKQRLGEEANELLGKGIGNLSNVQLRRLNRLLLDAAFPQQISAVEQSSTRVSYPGIGSTEPLPFDREGLQDVIKSVLASAMSFLLGTLGVFVAILVTASIIPQTYEAGAIDLLLSKPVSRSLLFLTKFFGGCAFILLNSAYLITGLWLISGLRYNLWSSKLLLCIPVFLFLFSIYYAVSAFAGVVWRNAIICVVMAILFWAACFAVGTTKNVMETMFLNPKRLTSVVPAGDSLLATNAGGQTLEWHPTGAEWTFVFGSREGQAMPFGFAFPMIGPVYDPKGDRLVAIESASPGIGGFGGPGKLAIGKRSDGWRRVSSVTAPNGTHAIFVDREGHILVAGSSGVHRFEGNPSVEHKPMEVLGVDIAPQGKAGKFVDIGPDKPRIWRTPFAADINKTDDSLAFYSRGDLRILERTADGKYAIKRETNLDTEEAAVVGYSGNTVVAALSSGEIRVFDADTLEQVGSYRPFGSEKPRQIASADGRWFAVLYHNRKLWMYDAESGKPVDPDISGQGDVSAAAFAPDGRLFIADQFARVTEYDPSSWAVEARYEPPRETLDVIYRYIVNPIYMIFPKPGELKTLVSYILTDQETAAMQEDQEENLQTQRLVMNVWQPIWSNLAFLAVVLVLACIYIERRDF